MDKEELLARERVLCWKMMRIVVASTFGGAEERDGESD